MIDVNAESPKFCALAVREFEKLPFSLIFMVPASGIEPLK
jgi:hypothetical protein